MLLELHLTVAFLPEREPDLLGWIDAHGLARTHIVLSRGVHPEHVMITRRFSGSIADATARAREVRETLRALGVDVLRTKIEACVDPTLASSARYIEQHVKVRLQPGGSVTLPTLVAPLSAHVSRNPRRVFDDHEERFLTQRFSPGALALAERSLEDLLATLAAHGIPVIRVEREHVLVDDNLDLDAGWICADGADSPDSIPGTKPMIPKHQRAPAGYPAAYFRDDQRPNVFDPALRHVRNAFIKGAPDDAARADGLAKARSNLIARVLRSLASSALRERVVVRGSAALEVWFPTSARRARDLDLVVRDAGLPPDSDAAQRLLREITDLVIETLASAEVPHSAHHASIDSIWTYERAEGRRIAVPWMYKGTLDVVQVDVVFAEPLSDARERWVPAEPGNDPGAPHAWAWFASKAEQLAWKLLWLESDTYPQGKDLFDALLLATVTDVPLALLERVFDAKGSRWEHGARTDFVRRWDRLDWDGFAKQHPELPIDRAAALAALASLLRIA